MSVRHPKAKMSRKTLLNIIQEVQKRPCLWNPEDEHHNNRGRVSDAWKEVATALNMPEPVIRLKWKSLRDIFKRELMKKCETTSKGIMLYRGKWRCFMSMLFLHKNITARLLKNDIREPSNCSSNSTEPEPEDIKEEIVNNDEGMDESDDNNEAFDGDNVFAADFQPNQDPLPENRQQSSEDDYDLMFLKSLVPFFRELDPIRKLRIRNKIQDIIINEINAQGHFNSMH